MRTFVVSSICQFKEQKQEQLLQAKACKRIAQLLVFVIWFMVFIALFLNLLVIYKTEWVFFTKTPNGISYDNTVYSICA